MSFNVVSLLFWDLQSSASVHSRYLCIWSYFHFPFFVLFFVLASLRYARPAEPQTRPNSPARSSSPAASAPAKAKTTRQCRAGKGGRFGDNSARRQYYFERAVSAALPFLGISVLLFFWAGVHVKAVLLLFGVATQQFIDGTPF